MLEVMLGRMLDGLQKRGDDELLSVLDGRRTVRYLTTGVEFGVEIAEGVGSFADIAGGRQACALFDVLAGVLKGLFKTLAFVLRLLHASQALLVRNFGRLPFLYLASRLFLSTFGSCILCPEPEWLLLIVAVISIEVVSHSIL